MADVEMGDFLLQYYMQRRFNTMPATVRAQFDVYAKSDDFRGNMKDWKKKLMHTDADGNLVENAMPYSAPPAPHPDDLTSNMTMTNGKNCSRRSKMHFAKCRRTRNHSKTMPRQPVF